MFFICIMIQAYFFGVVKVMKFVSAAGTIYSTWFTRDTNVMFEGCP